MTISHYNKPLDKDFKERERRQGPPRALSAVLGEGVWNMFEWLVESEAPLYVTGFANDFRIGFRRAEVHALSYIGRAWGVFLLLGRRRVWLRSLGLRPAISRSSVRLTRCAFSSSPSMKEGAGTEPHRAGPAGTKDGELETRQSAAPGRHNYRQGRVSKGEGGIKPGTFVDMCPQHSRLPRSLTGTHEPPPAPHRSATQ